MLFLDNFDVCNKYLNTKLATFYCTLKYDSIYLLIL